MERFVETLIDGIATGSIYGALALALVLIYRSTGIVNFAQGEMAMFSTFVAWGLIQADIPVGLAVLITLVLSLIGGMVIERVLIRPVEGSPELTLVTVTLGLFILVNGLARWIWGSTNRGFPSLFPDSTVSVGGIGVSVESLGLVAILLGVVGVLYLIFQRTKLGLGMRAAAVNPAASRLVGVPVGRMLMIGWGLAAMVGALAGVLVAPRLFLDANLMGPVIIYAFAAATLGGFDSPFGAVLGGWIIGVAEALAGGYVDFIGQDLKILVPLAVILTVLLVRPHGLLGSPEVARA
ncbi:MAG TPA: branched-chain amino acid ABC transporter permease [Solirubrobacter sp.]|nr:branched-chain amino acid ABC transporter permease [Solirubrobacter sp.]